MSEEQAMYEEIMDVMGFNIPEREPGQYTQSELAKLGGVSRDTVRNRIEAGLASGRLVCGERRVNGCTRTVYWVPEETFPTGTE